MIDRIDYKMFLVLGSTQERRRLGLLSTSLFFFLLVQVLIRVKSFLILKLRFPQLLRSPLTIEPLPRRLLLSKGAAVLQSFGSRLRSLSYTIALATAATSLRLCRVRARLQLVALLR